MALKAQGVKIKMGDGASPEVFTEIPGIISFNGPDGEAAIIPATTLASTRHEKLMGLADEGRIVCGLLFDPGNVQHQALITARNSQAAKNFKLDYNTTPAEVDSFAGFVMSVTRGGEVDGRIEGQFVIEITGEVTNADT